MCTATAAAVAAWIDKIDKRSNKLKKKKKYENIIKGNL